MGGRKGTSKVTLASLHLCVQCGWNKEFCWTNHPLYRCYHHVSRAQGIGNHRNYRFRSDPDNSWIHMVKMPQPLNQLGNGHSQEDLLPQNMTMLPKVNHQVLSTNGGRKTRQCMAHLLSQGCYRGSSFKNRKDHRRTSPKRIPQISYSLFQRRIRTDATKKTMESKRNILTKEGLYHALIPNRTRRGLCLHQ